MLKYVEDLMRKNYEAVGFLPMPRIEHYAERGQILLQTENDEPCGYLIFGTGYPVTKIYQCCIQVDARRRDKATEVVWRLIRQAEKYGSSAISLWCADDLEANHFWKSLGFKLSGQRDNGNRRGRLHNLWVLRLVDSKQPDLFHNDNVR